MKIVNKIIALRKDSRPICFSSIWRTAIYQEIWNEIYQKTLKHMAWKKKKTNLQISTYELSQKIQDDESHINLLLLLKSLMQLRRWHLLYKQHSLPVHSTNSNWR